MRVKNCTKLKLLHALKQVNKEQGYELEFNRHPERRGNWLHFTIKSKRSGIPGARYSRSGRKLISASWHAHGYLFDAILEIATKAIIKTASATIYKDADGVFGNWQDYNIGSMMFSEVSII